MEYFSNKFYISPINTILELNIIFLNQKPNAYIREFDANSRGFKKIE